MSDIVERLRQYVTLGGSVYESDAMDAITEIGELRQERDIIRENNDKLGDDNKALRSRLAEAEACLVEKHLRLAEAEALLRYVCSLHPDNCGCSGCKFAFLTPDSASVEGEK